MRILLAALVLTACTEKTPPSQVAFFLPLCMLACEIRTSDGPTTVINPRR